LEVKQETKRQEDDEQGFKTQSKTKCSPPNEKLQLKVDYENEC